MAEQALISIPSTTLYRFTFPHVRIIIRELRVLVYSQFLESYKSVRLASMAQSFGVGVDFLDR